MAHQSVDVTLGEKPKGGTMKVADIMTTNVFTAGPEMPLRDVATRMLEYGISGLPVVDEEGCVLGVLSETDILYKERTAPKRDGLVDWLVHYGEDPPAAKLNARTAGQAMTTPAVTITPRRSVADAAELMLEVGIDRLPVVDAGELVGIVTRADLVRAFTREDEEIEREIKRDVFLAKLWVDPADVKVHVEDGYVTLEGRVESEGVAEQIVHFAHRVPGVVSIEPRLTWPDAPAPRAVGKTLA
jgi:CBS domain-containing protein